MINSLFDKLDGRFGSRIKEEYIKKHFIDEWYNIHAFAKEYRLEKLLWKQKFYHYLYEWKEIPKCVCGKEVNFSGRRSNIYSKYCSLKCSAIDVSDKRQITLEKNLIEKYGVRNVFQLEFVKDKTKETCLDKYGVEYHTQNKEIQNKIKEICLEKYGVISTTLLPYVRERMLEVSKENWNNPEWVKNFHNILIKNNGGIGFASSSIKEKYVLFCQEKWGVNNSFQATEIKNKIKETCLDRYGSEYAMQNASIYTKSARNGKKIFNYKDTNLYYQGTYELDFLNKYYDKFIVERGKFIKYDCNGKSRVYYPDFYLPEFNLIVEIKSDYIWNKQVEKNEAIKTHLIQNNIKHCIIINKNYTNFNHLIINSI